MTTVELAKKIIENTQTLHRSPTKFEHQLAQAVVEAEAIFSYRKAETPEELTIGEMDWLSKHAGKK